MLIVETIARIKRAFKSEGKSIRRIARELHLSRKAVRKAIRSPEAEFRYQRTRQPRPQLEPFVAQLEALLEADAKKPPRERLSCVRLFETLQAEGYEGGYDTVRRYVRRWTAQRASGASEVFIPLWFAPGEAYQFDWSHETARLDGVNCQIKVAHVRLCHSRMFLVRAYPRETQEMVFDAHERAFRLFGGACRRGIYDNMRTAVDSVFAGKQRAFNRRFLQMCAHYLVEPTACTPSAGWEKGQVENQVRTVRSRFFTPTPRFTDLAELNAWLEEQCLTWAKRASHPQQKGRTVWEVFEAERPALIPYAGPFDGFHEIDVPVSKSSLVRYDYNRYSVAAKAARRTVQLRAYADRIVVWLEGEIIGEHARCFSRHQTIYDPWHYVPVLARKPGALRNGEPFRDWPLPPALGQVRQHLAGHDDGDRQFVAILCAVAEDGLEAVEAACAEALAARLFSHDVVLNILARRREPERPAPMPTPASLTLGLEPQADCARYDALRDRGVS